MTSTHAGLGHLNDNDSRTVISTGAVNVITLDSLKYKNDTLTLQSRAGFEDYFIFNVLGDFDFYQSSIVLEGTIPEHVIFNFLNDSEIKISKDTSEIYGTFLAPIGSVEYHNPATFEGAILAMNIDVHSYFNIKHRPFEPLNLTTVGTDPTPIFPDSTPPSAGEPITNATTPIPEPTVIILLLTACGALAMRRTVRMA